MKTNNHPENGPLTVERITRVRDQLQRSLQYQNGGDMAYVIADAIKGLEELLVSRKEVDETTMWVKRLAHSLRHAKPSSKLPNDAMAYLSKSGLISVEDVLR